jgi:8-oxo-dGTP pyrophosphatase MutT (NUDIX family)
MGVSGLARETPEQAVKREVLEETALDVEVGIVAGRSTHATAYFARMIGGDVCAGGDASECEFVAAEEVVRRDITPGLADVLRDVGVIA